MRTKGFTLIELLAVLVILGLLAIVVSGLVNNTVNNAKVTITKAQESSILNAVEKWSVDNSSEFDDIEEKVSIIGLDVLFIIDASGSMRKTLVGSIWNQKIKETRYYHTTNALNLAMDALKSPNNRIMITTFGQSNRTVLPLASYSSSNGKYFEVADNPDTYSSGSVYNTSAVKSTANLRKVTVDGSGNIKETKVSTVTMNFNEGNTYTQQGMYYAANQFINSTSSSNTINRIPVVIFITDGYPSSGSSSYCKSCTSSAQSATGLASTFYYTLMAGYETRDMIDKHYYASDIFYYTIGFGIDEHADAKKILDPGSYSKLSKWNYVTKAFQQTGMTAADLNFAFSSITTEVIEATNVTQVCITVKDLYDNGYLSKKDLNMADGEAAATYVIMSSNEATGQWSYALAKTPEQERICKALLSAGGK